MRLGFLHGISNEDIGTLLVGATSVEQLKNNIKWIADAHGGLTEEDLELIHELQHGVFADMMNLGWIEDGTQRNICEATFQNPHWEEWLDHQ